MPAYPYSVVRHNGDFYCACAEEGSLGYGFPSGHPGRCAFYREVRSLSSTAWPANDCELERNDHAYSDEAIP